jgi:hypothetical protein
MCMCLSCLGHFSLTLIVVVAAAVSAAVAAVAVAVTLYRISHVGIPAEIYVEKTAEQAIQARTEQIKREHPVRSASFFSSFF